MDLSAVAAATDGLSGAELESIVNEAAIYAVRRVSMQLSDGKAPTDVDHTVYPQDFEAVSRVSSSLAEKPSRTTTQWAFG